MYYATLYQKQGELRALKKLSLVMNQNVLYLISLLMMLPRKLWIQSEEVIAISPY